jgi:branched-subunit amino acid aminotransferase/4-amino-4-deoxychorismate lyase
MADIAKRVEVLIDIGLSKLVFMNGDGRIQILNEQMGHWSDDGVWYSNHSYTNYKVYDETFGMIDYNPENWQVSADVFDF